MKGMKIAKAILHPLFYNLTDNLWFRDKAYKELKNTIISCVMFCFLFISFFHFVWMV